MNFQWWKCQLLSNVSLTLFLCSPRGHLPRRARRSGALAQGGGRARHVQGRRTRHAARLPSQRLLLHGLRAGHVRPQPGGAQSVKKRIFVLVVRESPF